MKMIPARAGNVGIYPFMEADRLMDYTADKKRLLLSLNAGIIMRTARPDFMFMAMDFSRQESFMN